ncbi:epoxide hydrolase [Dictyobacter alpinus]|uniref:Epoxide hydrolase n=1 Tax=Dictyobacter alpinus TaxID=2014873 RepID=A0A402B5S9_9CHLR|nr:alpha/beta hydrolase [Dictyobacter alpinus]GCE26706.1 epoxide hydrolase [Dictyobacter alpinus]
MVGTAETWQHQDIMTNTIRMHYVIEGTGPLIVLLHGFPEYWYSWRFQIPFLANLGYTVVAPDLRGYNDTDKPNRGYDIPTLLRDIVGLIKGLGHEKAIIIGHDWGGVLAWNFAMDYPQMTERLVVLNAPHPGAYLRELRNPQQLRKSWYVFAFQIPWLPEFMLSRNNAAAIGRLIQQSAAHKEAFPPEVLAHYQEAMSKPHALTASINYYRALFNRPFSFLNKQAKKVINVPTLIIWGEQDVALDSALTEGLDQWITNLKIKRIPDSGHWVQQERPELVNQFLAEFLQPTSPNLL